MAKIAAGADDHAKVKLRVIEFELEGSNAAVENSIRQLTSALGTRPAAPKALPVKAPKELASPDIANAEEELEPEIIEADAAEPSGDDAVKPKVVKSKYKPALPNYLHDLDMAGTGTSFKDFVAAKAPTKHTTRYLVAALWLKEHGNSPTINTDKIYTCYKTASWPLNITDWDVNFRGQVKTDRFRRVEGGYAITPLGEEQIKPA
jgi:hypothetical protein